MKLPYIWRVPLGFRAFVVFMLWISAFCGTAVQAQTDEGFANFLVRLSAMSRAQGVSQQTIDAVIPTLTLRRGVGARC